MSCRSTSVINRFFRILPMAFLGWIAAGLLLAASAKPAFAASAPARVTGLKAEAGSRSVTLSWKSVKGASGYRIVVRKSGAVLKTLSVKKGKASAATVSKKIKNLENGTEYSFRVCAVASVRGQKTEGRFSKKVKAVPFSGRLAKPQPEIESFRDGKLVLFWEPVEGAAYYEISKKEPSGKYALLKKTKKTRKTITGLDTEKTEYLKITAVGTRNGKTVRSKAAKVQAKELTAEEMRALAAKVNVSNVNNTGLYNASTVITRQQAESYANYGNNGSAFSSLNNYLVWVNLYSQRTFLFERKSASAPWTMMWSTPCITGKMGSVTPYGIYKFTWASPIHYYSVKDNRYAQYLCFFIRSNWSIHTFMYPDNDEYENHPETFTKGFMASEGCVRLPRKYAKSVFDHCLNTAGNVVKVTETGSTIVVH